MLACPGRKTRTKNLEREHATAGTSSAVPTHRGVRLGQNHYPYIRGETNSKKSQTDNLHLSATRLDTPRSTGTIIYTALYAEWETKQEHPKS